MIRLSIILTLLLRFWLSLVDAAFAQLAGTGDFHIAWEVKNRFRLFRHEADFLRMAAASRGDGVLAAERRLARDTDGLGWAKDVVAELCLDSSGKLARDLRSRRRARKLPLAARLSGRRDHFRSGAGGGRLLLDFQRRRRIAARQSTAPCDHEVKLRVRSSRTTIATVDIPLGDGTAQRRRQPISRCAMSLLPDSAIPSPPAKAIRTGRLSSKAASASNASLAAAAANTIARAGPAMATIDLAKTDRRVRPRRSDWARHGARWMNPACHRSLYSYQVRTALALAIEQPHVAVTMLPLACTGATIGAGMFASQRADDCPWVVGIDSCSGTAPAQFSELRDLMTALHRQQPNRNLDLVLLTVGANDVNFAG